KHLSHMYRYAWRTGLKTTYYLRTQAASNIEKATVSKKKQVAVIAEEFREEDLGRTCDINAGPDCEACQ
ncbi:MAG: hypothetical protein MH204_06445, partial [Fimbriimonadaceae bacterium]|nr:hypothetical protein [Fimbriimonadaceae bacterium]